MTGFGSSKASAENIDVEVEIKSINARYLDQRLYLPRELMFFEAQVRKQISSLLTRGTVEIRISISDHRDPALELDSGKLLKYHNLAKDAAILLGKECDVSLEFLLQEPGVIENKVNLAEDTVMDELLNRALGLALNKLNESVKAEAVQIGLTLNHSLQLIENAVDKVHSLCLPYKDELYQKMLKRIEEISGSYKLENQEQRIMQELAIYVDKYDIGEEISRLKTHLVTFRETLKKSEDIGKTLNFIIQEMQREANTLGSKFSTSSSFSLILTIKEEIEKCREIIQNVA